MSDKKPPYKFPPPGESDALGNLRHFCSHITPFSKRHEFDETLEGIDLERNLLCELLLRYENGTYSYPHSESFNPEVAKQLRLETAQVMQLGADPEALLTLERKWLTIAATYAVEIGREDDTSYAHSKCVEQILREREESGA